jgi:hypothetical protein
MPTKSIITVALIAIVCAASACKDDKKSEPAVTEKTSASEAEAPKKEAQGEAETKPAVDEGDAAEGDEAADEGDDSDEMDEPSADDFD